MLSCHFRIFVASSTIFCLMICVQNSTECLILINIALCGLLKWDSELACRVLKNGGNTYMIAFCGVVVFGVM